MLILIAVVAVLALGYLGAPLWIWTLAAFGLLWAVQAPEWIWITLGVVSALFVIRPIRAALISRLFMNLMIRLQMLPKISDTEKAALKAGDVWVEKELFSGKPDFDFIRKQPYPSLTAEEQAFIDGPIERLCEMSNDWEIWKNGDLPQEVWDFIKKEKIFGMIIPKEYGGLGFSALAHSEVIMKLNSRCGPLAITVMVPNSLGPAELLNHYGTEAQKNHYLPRLARGEEIPCFALTEPEAGSDAGSLKASGVVFKGDDGKLYIKLNWNKRWITLAAVSTVMGLAFRLRDPDRLLGGEEERGITCALVPTKTPGITADRRHSPLGTPFYNCPTQGKDVVVPIDAIIGGPERAGQGWTMLMESLAAGRGISLPGQSAGSAKLFSRVASAHSLVRKQFGVSIGKFEGIAEPLARVASFTYILEALRKYTCGALDQGRKPAIITAIAKYNSTEMSRTLINDGMDIRGGAGISLGPKNIIGHHYITIPISITVEGANIMTRSLIIFGQGAIRCHPYAYLEIDALDRKDVSAFDKALWGHIGHVVRNGFRALLLTLTRGWLALPFSTNPERKYYRRLAWSSAHLAFLADLAMMTFGGTLKTREKLTGRFADLLSWLYLSVAVLRRYEAEGRQKADKPLLEWSMGYSFTQLQKALDGIYGNFNIPLVGFLFKGPIRWFAALNPIGRMPNDEVDFEIAKLMMTEGAPRNRVVGGSFLSRTPSDGLARLEHSFVMLNESEASMRKVQQALRKRVLKKQPMPGLIEEALQKGVITAEEKNRIQEAEKLRVEAIQVDDFPVNAPRG